MMTDETHAVLILNGTTGTLTRKPGRQPKEVSPVTRRALALENDARDLSRLLLTRRIRFPTPPLSMKLIALAVGQHYGVPLSTIKNGGKYKRPLEARRVAYYLCRKLTANSYPQIGQFFGKDHTCPLRSWERINARLARGENELADAIAQIERAIG
jgi:chromosomal replication initiation ATPase DnaA